MRGAFITSLALALAACGSAAPRFAEVTVSSAAPTATLSGSTRAAAPAIELSPGCPGYLDPSAPEHVVHVSDPTTIRLTARSNRGPLALVVAGGGEIRCDSDNGSGHAPHVTLEQPGDYRVHVASLHEASDLPYELAIAPESAPSPIPGGGDRLTVSVTVTSDPPGAIVRTPEGQPVGTTPALFAVTVPSSEVGSERRYVLELPGHQRTEVNGRVIGGAMVLHASLPREAGWGVGRPSSGPAVPAGPELIVSATQSQRITDYRVSRQSLEVPVACTIERAGVDVDIRHSFIGDLRVVLRSPSGTEVVLHNHSGGGRANLVTSWDWNARNGALQRLAGENANGRWEMAVHDDAAADVGSFRSFTLRLQCREGGVVAEPAPEAPRAAAPERVTQAAPAASAPPRPRPTRSRPARGDLVNPWPPSQVAQPSRRNPGS